MPTGDGQVLGTLCAIDHTARSLSADEASVLRDLAAIVVGELELRRHAKLAIQAEGLLVDAVEALPDGFVLYDADDRLVMCNGKYKEIYAESADLLEPGASREGIIRIGVARGQYPEAVSREEAWIAERMARHLDPAEPIEQALPGNRWLCIQERRTRSGGAAAPDRCRVPGRDRRGGHFFVTVSIGVTACRPDRENLEAALARADVALYAAKKRGRNQVASEMYQTAAGRSRSSAPPRP